MSSSPAIVLVGFGCVGQAVLPLLEAAFPAAPITVIDQTLDVPRQALIARHGLHAIETRLASDNYTRVLGPLLRSGFFLLNLAPSVCSMDLIALAQARGAFYLDTGIEPWDYEEGESCAHLSNAALRSRLLAFARGRVSQPTALVAHGANPGLVSLLVKDALLHLAAHAGLPCEAPVEQVQWAQLARRLGVRLIQIAEHDSQRVRWVPASGEFTNTWSAEGFITECLQDAELGWGSHEGEPPSGACRAQGHPAALVLPWPGHRTRVRSWSPTQGPFDGYLITHNESLSIAEYLRCDVRGEAYQPTVYYAYRPTEATQASMRELGERDMGTIVQERILKDEIVDGMDELGVLLFSERYGALWHGSCLNIQQARERAPYNSATSLQVAAGVVAGLRWIAEHPACGVLESDALDPAPLLRDAAPWWGPLVTRHTDWRPVTGTEGLRFTAFLHERAQAEVFS